MSRVRDAATCVAASLTVAVVLVVWLQLWRKDLSVPFNTSEDGLFWVVVAKAVYEDGMLGPVRRLGMPFGSELVDWLPVIPADFTAFRLLMGATGSPGGALNLYWLLSLVATAAISTFCFRCLRFDRLLAFALGVLYALFPHGLFTNTAHVVLVFHFVPLLATLGLKIAEGGEVGRAERVVLLTGCALQGLSYVYYSFFACALLVAAATLGWARTRRGTPLRLAAAGVALIGVCTAASVAPSLMFWRKNGSNPEVIYKTAAQAEMYGLKIRHLLTPIPDHPLPAFRRLSAAAAAARFPDETENVRARLGTVGSLGFLGLLGVCLLSTVGVGLFPPLLRSAAVLNLVALLLGQVGAFGSLFSLLVSPDIRAYNRIVVFIAFFSLTAVGAGVAALSRRFGSLLPALLLILVPDQVPAQHLVAHYEANAAGFRSDAGFVAEVEARLPAGAMVFQLPHTDVPLERYQAPMPLYDQGRAYVHSRSLRWSWGGIMGRHGNWQRATARLPPPDLLRRLALTGFSGVWVDHLGYPEGGGRADPTRAIAEVAGSPLLESPDGRVSFVSLLDFRAALEKRMGPEEYARAREEALTTPLVPRWGDGFFEEEVQGRQVSRWCGPTGWLVIKNHGQVELRVILEAQLRSGGKQGLLSIESPMFGDRLPLTPEPSPYRRELRLDPGQKLRLQFSYAGETARWRGDPRVRAFQVIGFYAAVPR